MVTVEIVTDTGSSLLICTEEIAEAAEKEWIKWIRDDERDEDAVFNLQGFQDGWARLSSRVTVAMDSVSKITITDLQSMARPVKLVEATKVVLHGEKS